MALRGDCKKFYNVPALADAGVVKTTADEHELEAGRRVWRSQPVDAAPSLGESLCRADPAGAVLRFYQQLISMTSGVLGI